jgi:hypothetical protein
MLKNDTFQNLRHSEIMPNNLEMWEAFKVVAEDVMAM